MDIWKISSLISLYGDCTRSQIREEARVYDDYVRALLFEVAVSKGTNNKDSL